MKEKAKFIECGNDEFRVEVFVNGGAVHDRVTAYLWPHCIHQAFSRNNALPVPSPGFVSAEAFGFFVFTPRVLLAATRPSCGIVGVHGCLIMAAVPSRELMLTT